MSKKNKQSKADLNDYTKEDIDKMSEDEVEAFLDKFAPGWQDEYESLSDEDDEDGYDPERELEAALANGDLDDVELANVVAAAATSRANEALRRMADAEWRKYRDDAIDEGVPAHLLDLAEPILNRPDDMIIDLSSTNDDPVNASEVVRGFIDATRGLVDLSAEAGHEGSWQQGDSDPDQELLNAWEKSFGGSSARKVND